MKLYIIKAYNKHGGCVGTYYVAAAGVNRAKAALRASEPWCKKLELVDEVNNLIIAEQEKVDMTCEYSGLPSVKSYT